METDINDQNNSENKEEYPFHHYFGRMILAGIGVLSYSHEEFGKFVEKMVERGEVAHKDHQKRFKEMRERREHFLRDRKGDTQKKVAKALDHLDIATKDDIDDMNAKIIAMEKKIDELKKSPE